MTNYLAKSWEAKVYTEEQLKELAHITAQYTENELRDYHRRWQNVWAEVKQSLNQDPASPIGKQLATTWFGLVDELYGNHEDLKNAARKAYMDNKIPDVPFDKAIHDWIEKAVKAHGIQWPSKKK